MADIKTRDAVKGTIKTIDKAVIASERMKSAYVGIKEKRNRDITLMKTLPQNMLRTGFLLRQTVQRTKVSTSSISRGKRQSRQRRRISVRQKIK